MPPAVTHCTLRPVEGIIESAVILYAVVDEAVSPDSPLGVELEVFIRREDAERFIEEARGDDPEARELPADRGAGGSHRRRR